MSRARPVESVCICIITFQRPVSLRRTLEGLAKVVVPESVVCRAVVVDNDQDGEAAKVLVELIESFDFEIIVIEEAERGIPFARNAAVANAAGSDAIVWLDDDEVPREDWLLELVEAQHSSGAEILQGPSMPKFELGVSEWIEKGRFFERELIENLAVIDKHSLRTSSVLVTRDVFSVASPPFNEAMRFTGGTDSVFFTAAIQAGFEARWVENAIVDEYVPASRTTVRWLLRRSYRRGSVRSQMLVDSGATIPRRLRRALTGLRELSRMFPALLRGFGDGKAGLVRGLQPAAQAFGTWTGLIGRRYEEYRTVHGH